MKQLNALILVGAGAVFAASASNGDGVKVKDLGVLDGGSWSFAISINDRGQIAGNGDARGKAGYYRPVFWNHGKISELPLLKGVGMLPDDVNSNVHGINDRGEVVGWSGGADEKCPANSLDLVIKATCAYGSFPTGVVWHNGTVDRLIPPPAASHTLTGGIGFGITDEGDITVVTGHVTAACNTFACVNATRRATRLDDGVAAELPYLPTGTFSVPHAISASGAIVGYGGYTSSNTGPKHAALWSRHAVTDLGTFPGGTNSEAWAFNRRGQIVGYGTGKTAAGVAYTHAALWQHGMLTDLGTLSGGTASTAYGINRRGQIVGYSNTVAGGPPHAVLWECGKLIDLGMLPGGDGAVALAINNRGHIAGGSNGTHQDGSKFNEHAVLWTVDGDEHECDEGHDDNDSRDSHGD